MDVNVINGLLEQLARHYGVNRDYLLWLLLARQTLTIHTLTDYAKPATSSDLDVLLKAQDTKLTEVLDEARKRLGEVGRLIVIARQTLQESNAIVATAKRTFS